MAGAGLLDQFARTANRSNADLAEESLCHRICETNFLGDKRDRPHCPHAAPGGTPVSQSRPLGRSIANTGGSVALDGVDDFWKRIARRLVQTSAENGIDDQRRGWIVSSEARSTCSHGSFIAEVIFQFVSASPL